MTNEHYQKCPLCSQRFNRNELKSVKFTSINIPNLVVKDYVDHKDKEKNKEKEEEKGRQSKGKEKEKSNDREKEKGKEKEKEKEKENNYVFQLLSIAKGSLFPSLPGPGKGQGPSTEALKSSSSLSMKNKTPHFNYSSFAPGLHPSITTLSSVMLVPLDTAKASKFSRLVTVTAEGCLRLMEEERSQLLLYRQECLISGTIDSNISMLIDVDVGVDVDVDADADMFMHMHSRQHAAINNGSSSSAGIGTGTGTGAGTGTGTGAGTGAGSGTVSGTVGANNRPRSNSCWGANTGSASTSSSSSSSLPTQSARVRSESIATYGYTERYEQQGDTEYLPAITEALLLLREREEAFKEKCFKLGVSIAAITSSTSKEKSGVIENTFETLISSPANVTIGKVDEVATKYSDCSTNSNISNSISGDITISNRDKNNKNVHKTNVDNVIHSNNNSGEKENEKSSEIVICSSLSPSSAVFIPSSFTPPSSLLPPSGLSTNTQTCSLPSTLSSCTSSSVTAATTASSSSSSSSASTSISTSSTYHMFQSPEGHLIFLHPLCTKCLLSSVNNDPLSLPHTISGPVLELEKIRIDAAMKQKIPFLRHLPIYCEVIFIELEMKKLVSMETWNLFQEEFNKRAKRRNEKEKIRIKEKKIEHDQM